MSRKDVNEVVLTGYFKPRLSEDGSQVGGRLCTSERQQEGQPDAVQFWHTIVPMTKAAKDSIRQWKPPIPLACVKGRFRRREYLAEGKLRYANEIVVFDPITVPASTTRRAEIHVEGHLGAKPDVRYTSKGMAVITLSVATNSSRKDSAAPGGWVKETTWHNALLFGEEARKKVEGLVKGSFVCIEGELTYRPRKKREDGLIAEILVRALSSQGRDIIAPPQEDVLGRPFELPQSAQPALFPPSATPLTYAAGERF